MTKLAALLVIVVMAAASGPESGIGFPSAGEVLTRAEGSHRAN